MDLSLLSRMALFTLFFIGTLVSANENPIKKTFQHSVVEVLIDRPKDEATFNRPIPFQKIPFKQRTDRFLSIGTAWFINDKDLFSAAHVFGVNLASHTQNFYVRTPSGEVFVVDKFTLYSNKYDIVSFNLKTYPSRVIPIPLAKSYNIGDDVCVPGNALGQGIGLRCGGQIASLAPEPRNGEWKEVYFSTPVSPGNSGGPLIDTSGRALGIVIRKIQGEDLNIATPFNELRKLNFKLEHVEKDLGYQNNVVLPLYAKSDLKIGSHQALPAKEWMKLIAAGTNDHLMKMAKVYESTWLKNGALHAKQAKPYLQNPKKGGFFTQVKYLSHDLALVDGDEGDLEKVRRAKRKTIIQKIGDRSLFFVGKNRGEKTEALLYSPRVLMETILAAGKVMRRKIADEELTYTSLGEPRAASPFNDLLGRNWMVYSWKLSEVQTAVALFCTPRPSDIACVFHSYDAMLNPETVAAIFRIDISEFTLGYVGSSSEWAEFLDPANRLKPSFMSGMLINKSEGKTRIVAHDLSIVAPDYQVANDSVLVVFSSDLSNPLIQVAHAVTYFPNLADSMLVTAMKVYKGGKSPDEMGAWVERPGGKKFADGNVYRTKEGKFMVGRFIDPKNGDTALMGYISSDEERKINRLWKSIEFGISSPGAPCGDWCIY